MVFFGGMMSPLTQRLSSTFLSLLIPPRHCHFVCVVWCVFDSDRRLLLPSAQVLLMHIGGSSAFEFGPASGFGVSSGSGTSRAAGYMAHVIVFGYVLKCVLGWRCLSIRAAMFVLCFCSHYL